MAGLLGNIYSAIDSTKRKYGGLIADFARDPVTTAGLHMNNVGAAAAEQDAMLGKLYRDAQGKPTMDPRKWSEESRRAHDELTQRALGAVAGATVYHGTPHAFNKFDSSKIGTGEGKQVYGHGLYLAENPKVAEQYAKNVKDMGKVQAINDQLSGINQRLEPLRTGEYGVYKTPEGYALKEQYNKLMQQRAKAISADGNVYEADLPDEKIAKMLDFDNPVPDTLRQPLSQKALTEFGSGLSGTSGEHLLKELAFEFKQQGHANPNAAASEWLRSQGVPGVRYLDGMSRDGGTGTRNFVVFPGEEDALRILKRNGQSLLDAAP